MEQNSNNHGTVILNHKLLWLIGILDYVRTDGALYRTYMNSFKTVTRCLKHSSIVMTVTFACRGWWRAYFYSALIENELRKCGSEHHNNASTSVHRAATIKVKAITKTTREITVKFTSTFEGSSSIRIYSCFQRAEQNCGSFSVYSSYVQKTFHSLREKHRLPQTAIR